MSRYMKIAGEANEVATDLFELVTTDDLDTVTDYEQQVAVHIAKLVNYGLRCAPRAVQHTVRLNAVREAVKGLPVKVTQMPVTDPVTGRMFHPLRCEGVQL